MANNLMPTCKKLIQALNSRGYKLTLSTKQFVGREGSMHTLFILADAELDERRHRWVNHEKYSTTSVVRLVLYLRDMWYKENGWELPTDQELWNELRAKIDKGDEE